MRTYQQYYVQQEKVQKVEDIISRVSSEQLAIKYSLFIKSQEATNKANVASSSRGAGDSGESLTIERESDFWMKRFHDDDGEQ